MRKGRIHQHGADRGGLLCSKGLAGIKRGCSWYSFKASDDKVLSLKQCTMVICNGMTNSEMEDCFEPTVYKQELLDEFGVNIDSPKFRGNSKWSDRMRDVFLSQGKPWNDAIKSKVKYHVADCVKKTPAASLNQHKRNSIDAVMNSLELMVKS